MAESAAKIRDCRPFRPHGDQMAKLLLLVVLCLVCYLLFCMCSLCLDRMAKLPAARSVARHPKEAHPDSDQRTVSSRNFNSQISK